MRAGPVTYNEAFAMLQERGYQPVPGSSRFENAAGSSGRITAAMGSGDTFFVDTEDAEGAADVGGYREHFARGYREGERDVIAGMPRSLVASEGDEPPVVKSEDHSYYHGYKAAVEGRAIDEEGAWAAYVAKHAMRANGRNWRANPGPMGRRAVAQSRIIGPSEADGSPVGTLLWADDRAWVVVHGGIAPVALLSERAGGHVPDGVPAESIASTFALMREGDGRVPTHGTAQRHAIAWVQAARATPNPLHLSLDGNFSFGVGTKDDEHVKNARGIYAGVPGVDDGDYVLRSHRGRVYVDRVGRGGTHTAIGSTRGYDRVRDALKEAGYDSFREGNQTGLVSVQTEDGYSQIGNIVDGRFVPGGNDTLDSVEEYVREKLYRNGGAGDFEPNARKNVSAVIDAFAEGRRHSEKTCSTDGSRIYSYSMLIAARVDADGEPTKGPGRVLVLDTRESPSVTTSGQINAVHAAFRDAEVVTEFPHGAVYSPNAATDEDMVLSTGRRVRHRPSRLSPGATEAYLEDEGEMTPDEWEEYAASIRRRSIESSFGPPLRPNPRDGEVIPSRRWVHRGGRTASIYGAVPWTGVPGDREEDWHMEHAGWTIQWSDGTVGIGRVPFETREQAEAWLEKERSRLREAQEWRLRAFPPATETVPSGRSRRRHAPNWRMMLDLPGVERRIGADQVANILAMPNPKAHAESRAAGWWDANEPELFEAYTSLARMIEDGELDDLIAQARRAH
jgi:hypothetical protein